MPIYEYICGECHQRCEFLQKHNEALKTDCPSCSKGALKRQISVAGFRLSGDGYYETDEKPKEKQRNVASSQ